MVKHFLLMIAGIAVVGLFLGMQPPSEEPVPTAQDQNAFAKFIANTGRYYVASFTTMQKGDDVLARLDQAELQKLDQSGRLQALLQGEGGGVLVILSAFTSDEARGLAGPLKGAKAKSVKLQIRPAIVTKSFADTETRKPITAAAMESFEAAYSVKGKTFVAEGNERSRKIIPEHVTLVSSLFDEGVIKMYLSFEDSEDPRGFFVFSGKSRDEIRKHFANDPLLKEKWVEFDFISCKAPEGTFK